MPSEVSWTSNASAGRRFGRSSCADDGGACVVAFATFDSPDSLSDESNAVTSKLYAVIGARLVTVWLVVVTVATGVM